MENLEIKKHRTVEGYEKALQKKAEDLLTRSEYESDPVKVEALHKERRQVEAELAQLRKVAK